MSARTGLEGGGQPADVPAGPGTQRRDHPAWIFLVTFGVLLAGQGALRILETGLGSMTGGATSVWRDPATGAFWAISICVGGGVELMVVGLWLRCGSKGIWRETLGLRSVSRGTLVFWGAMAVLFAGACDGITWLAGHPVVPEVMHEAYRTCGSPVLFWVALVGVAPWVEEVVFRGLLFGALERSVLGRWGAIGITAGLWAATHGQYDAWGLSIVVLAGLFLGWVRSHTRSTMVTGLMHGLLNTVAVLEAMVAAAHG